MSKHSNESHNRAVTPKKRKLFMEDESDDDKKKSGKVKVEEPEYSTIQTKKESLDDFAVTRKKVRVNPDPSQQDDESTQRKRRISRALNKSDEKENSKGGKKSKPKKGKDFFTQKSDEESEDEDPFQLPSWLQDRNIRDKQGRRKAEEGYDHTTVLVPDEERKKMTNVQKQYWNFKSKHFEKLVAYKIWNFYDFYWNDALILKKLFDVEIIFRPNGLFVAHIAESIFADYIPRLLESGYKIAIVEQTEPQKNKKDDVINRDVCQIITKGTYTDCIGFEYTSKFCLCIIEEDLHFGVVYLDTTTNEFYIGDFEDDRQKGILRTLITKINPVEVVYSGDYISSDTLTLIKGLSNPPALTSMPSEEFVMKDFIKKLQRMFTPSDMSHPKYPDFIDNMILILKEEMTNMVRNKMVLAGQDRKLPFYYSFQALSLALSLLENALLADTVFVMGTYYPFEIALQNKSALYLDGQALENLEVLEINYLNGSKGMSLLKFMDKTVTAFGKRLFKKWLTSPLTDPSKIVQRLDAVEDLMNNFEILEFYQKNMSKVPDFARSITKIYNLTSKQKSRSLKMESYAKAKLREFLKVIDDLKQVDDFIKNFIKTCANKFESKRLIQLTTFRDVDIQAFENREMDEGNKSKQGLFPRIQDILKGLRGMIDMQDGTPVPARGVNPEADAVMYQLDAIKEELDEILVDQRKKYGYKFIKYVNTHMKYEIEVPEEIWNKIKKGNKDYSITSKKKGYVRYHTPRVEEAISRLETHQAEFDKIMAAFVVELFKKFYERNSYWQQVVLCLAELDCLCSLARVSKSMNQKCRPNILPQSTTRIFELENLMHPCLMQNNPNFVGNDVKLEPGKEIFLITGPNMGGKSTLLRQTCIAVIMAQVGCFVPATSFRFSVIDRIFTRIGASDRITEGKSTYFVELEETFHIVTEATQHSLLIVDELGRGTSTYDGVSIAFAVLKYLATKLHCLTLFATHYHLLIEEFKIYDNITTYQMMGQYDQKRDELTFLYKFMPGTAHKSHGIYMAKIAGLPEEVIEIAKSKEKYVTQEKRNIGYEKSMNEKFNGIVKELDKFSKEEGNPNFTIYELYQLIWK